jgi:4-diphosphocytidyl-2-C-methyl-D-erythritol kinase
MRLSAEAPAKINRELRVGKIRDDGYHEVFSRMVSIDLADRLTAETADALTLTCDDPAVPLGRENLVVQAAELLAQRAGIAPSARIHLEKRTPMGGGLGGGSADAAIALLLLARLWDCDAGVRAELPGLAARLGSDVPFFLTGGEAEVTGRGEIVRPVEDSPRTPLLLLVPPFPVPTAAVYQAYAGRGILPRRLEVAEPGRRRYLGPNDLTPAVLKVEPRMEGYLASAARVSDDFAVSGSGATIVLRDVPGAREDLARRHPEARLFACTTLSRDACRIRINPERGAP